MTARGGPEGGGGAGLERAHEATKAKSPMTDTTMTAPLARRTAEGVCLIMHPPHTQENPFPLARLAFAAPLGQYNRKCRLSRATRKKHACGPTDPLDDRGHVGA